MAEEGVLELDSGGGGVGAVAGLSEGVAGGGDVEDAASGGDEFAITQGGACMEDVDMVQGGGVFDAGDGQVFAVVAGVSARGDDEAHGMLLF